jgi:hypothetical protein
MGKRNKRKQKWDEGGHWEGHAVAMVYTPPNEFPTFWFEGNQVFHEISSREQLNDLVDAHVEGWRESREYVIPRLMMAQTYENSVRNVPEFGLYSEHNGKETLGAYLERHGIKWPSSETTPKDGGPS